MVHHTYTEPGAGTDIGSLQMRCIDKGDHYELTGTKIFITSVHFAKWHWIAVRTDPDAARPKGISTLLVSMDLPGIEVREIPSVVGERYFHEVFFTDTRVPVNARLGPEHEGWDVVSYALQYERVGAARYARAALTRSYCSA